jgi:hypothetical protein
MHTTSHYKSVGLVTCEALPTLFDDDRLLVDALTSLGVRAEPLVWSRPDIDWKAFDALVMRSPWDYFERVAEFQPWLQARIAEGARLHNPAEVLRWNFDKRYLQDLFGGAHEAFAPSASLIAQARTCLQHAPGSTTYARVDGLVLHGDFVLMELEVFEPLMFLSAHAQAPQRFAQAIQRRSYSSK